MGRRRRLSDLFARQATPPDADVRPQSYEVDDLIELALDGGEPDVEDVARTCGASHARLWNRIEDEFLREEGHK